MTERRYVLVTAAFASLGAAVAGYLTYAHYADERIVCPTAGCETVQSSQYSEVFGAPVALLGLVAYVAILVALLALPEAGRWLVLVTALAGCIFSTYLVGVQAFEIRAFCVWCLTSDALVTAIAVLAVLHVRVPTITLDKEVRGEEDPRRLRRL